HTHTHTHTQQRTSNNHQRLRKRQSFCCLFLTDKTLINPFYCSFFPVYAERVKGSEETGDIWRETQKEREREGEKERELAGERGRGRERARELEEVGEQT